MALFRKSDDGKRGDVAGGKAPTLPQKAYCKICEGERSFTNCWRRVGYVTQCEFCREAIPDPAARYKDFQASCPRCEELLEQPNFEYGICDGCGSKYELVVGTLPGILPNRAQREAMKKHGPWSPMR